jgi:hypothetical protein
MRRYKTTRTGSKVLVAVALITGATIVTRVSDWHAQEAAASVVGWVKDTSGAIMPPERRVIRSEGLDYLDGEE